MVCKEKLNFVIRQAINNGWDGNNYRDYYSTIFNHSFAKAFWGTDRYCWWSDGEFIDSELTEKEYLVRLKIQKKDGEYWNEYMPFWQYMLRIMVILDDPLEFLVQHTDTPNTNNDCERFEEKK